MRGYILYAVKLMNANDRAEYNSDTITETTLRELMRYLYRATDDMTADEAQAYYINSDI